MRHSGLLTAQTPVHVCRTEEAWGTVPLLQGRSTTIITRNTHNTMSGITHHPATQFTEMDVGTSGILYNTPIKGRFHPREGTMDTSEWGRKTYRSEWGTPMGRRWRMRRLGLEEGLGKNPAVEGEWNKRL